MDRALYGVAECSPLGGLVGVTLHPQGPRAAPVLRDSLLTGAELCPQQLLGVSWVWGAAELQARAGGCVPRVPAGPAPTASPYLLKSLGKEKQRGFVTSSQGRKLEAIMYTEQNVSGCLGRGRFHFKRTESPIFCVPATCSPFLQWLLGAPWSSPYSQRSVGTHPPKGMQGEESTCPALRLLNGSKTWWCWGWQQPRDRK